jgi:hypothetical protein
LTPPPPPRRHRWKPTSSDGEPSFPHTSEDQEATKGGEGERQPHRQEHVAFMSPLSPVAGGTFERGEERWNVSFHDLVGFWKLIQRAIY